MPTKLRRIAVTVDPQLAAALREARKEAPDKSDAALIKDLALRGSRTGPQSQASSALERILAMAGVRMPSTKLESVISKLEDSRTMDTEAFVRILEEDRADREIL